MQGRWVLDSTITESEVERDCQVNFAAAENVLEESVPLLDFRPLQRELAVWTLNDGSRIIVHVVSQLLNIKIDASNILVPAILLRNKELDLNVFGFI